MRIYQLEEQDESVADLTSLDQQSSVSRQPPSFAELKELYISNLQKKEGVSLKKQLSEKEELVLKAATTASDL